MWFTANLFFKSRHPDCSENEFLWESRIVWIEASSKNEALTIAQDIGKNGECEYIAANSDLVKWTFERVERIFQVEVDQLRSGVELFSWFLRESEVKSLLTPFED